jgi:hypothetical protein
MVVLCTILRAGEPFQRVKFIFLQLKKRTFLLVK